MAKLTGMPSLAIIDGFRGKIDFYQYHPTCDPENRGEGVAVARKWPRSPGHLRSAAVMAQWADFSYSSGAWLLLSKEIQEAYLALAAGSGLSGRDLFTRSYLSGLYRYEHYVEEEMPITLYTTRVHKSGASQAIPPGADTKVTFDVKDWDPDGCFDLVNNRFIAPEAGYYLCVAQAHFNTPLFPKSYVIGLQLNAAWHSRHCTQSSKAWDISPLVTSAIHLAVDDFVEVVVWHDAGVNDDVNNGSANTFFEIHRLS